MPVPVTTKTVTAPAVGAGNSAVYQKTITDAVQEIQTNLNSVVTQPVMDLALSSAPSIGNGAWTQVTTLNTTPSYSGGIGMTSQSSGVKVSTAGRYQVDAIAYWASNGTGVRYVGVSVNGVSPTQVHQVSQNAVSGGATSQFFTDEIGCAINDVVSLMVYQTSGAALALSYARLCVRALTD